MTEMKETVERIIEYLKQHGKEIAEASTTNKTAQKIITYYDMFQKCPEAGSLVKLENAIEEYKEYKKTNYRAIVRCSHCGAELKTEEERKRLICGSCYNELMNDMTTEQMLREEDKARQ